MPDRVDDGALPPTPEESRWRGWAHWLWRLVGRLGVRLLLVNGVVLLVPVVGLEFARIHERQLLEALERDMKNQAALVRAMVESTLDRGGTLGDPTLAEILTAAARSTRTRVRVLDERGGVVIDSHENGPPEGPELPVPRILGRSVRGHNEVPLSDLQRDPGDPNVWPEVAERVEVRAALGARRDRARASGRAIQASSSSWPSPSTARAIRAAWPGRCTRRAPRAR